MKSNRTPVLLLAAALLGLSPVGALAANRYWVGGSGNWSNTARWAATSGGAGGASVPSEADNAYFDAASGGGTATVDVAATCADLVFTGSTVTFAGASALSIYGSLNLSAGMTRTYTGAITFAARSTGKTLTFNGKATASGAIFNGPGGGWTLVDDWNNGASDITLTAGSLNTGGQAVTGRDITFTATSLRSFTLGGSTVSGRDWNAATTNLTFAPGASVLVLSRNFTGAGLSYNEVRLNGAASTVTGANTFAVLNRTGTATKTDTLILSADQTITDTLVLAGNSAVNRLSVLSSAKGTRRTLTASVVSASNVDIQDVAGSGAASWNLSAVTGNSGDAGGNAGITFTSPQTNYWVDGTGNWSAAAQWASTGGGAGGTGRVPLPQDTARFDSSSFASGGQTVTGDMPRSAKDVDFTGVTNSPTITFSAATSLFGSLTLDAVTLGAGAAVLTFEGRGSHTLKSAGLTFEKPLTLDAPGGTLTLDDAFTLGVTNILTVTRGTFDANNKNVTVGLFAATSANVRTLTMGSGVWSLTGSGTVWNLATITLLTFNKGTSLIKFTDNSGTDKTFSGGGLAYNDLWNATAGAGKLVIVGSNAFNEFKSDAGRTVRFTAATTQTISTFTATGSAGNLITLESSAAAIFTLNKSGGGSVSADYVSVSWSSGTPAGTWYAGTNSTNGGNNSNWVFTAPPAGASRYWVGGTGNWSDTAHWSASSGGAGGASVPSSSDNVFFNGSSGGGTATMNVTGQCIDLDFTGYTGTFAGASALTVYGSLTLAAGMTRTFTGAVNFVAATTGKTLTFNGKTLASAMTFNGVGGGWTLQDALNNGAANITLTAGTLDTNGQSVTTTGIFSVTGTSPRALTCGASALTFGDWTAATSENLTFTPGTSIMTVTTGGTFSGGGLTYNEVRLTNAAAITVAQANTFAILTRTGTAVTTDSVSFSAGQTVTGTLNLNGNSSINRILVNTTVRGTPFTLTAAAVSASNVDFEDIVGAGAASWNLSAITGLSGDAGGNSGITFTTGLTNYWVGGTGNWSAVAEWGSASGAGGGTGRVPLPQDDARFDANSFGGAGLTVTANMPRLARNIDWTGVTNTPAFTLSTITSIFGSLTLATQTLGAGATLLTFEGRGAHTLTSAGLTFDKPITLDAPGGSLTLQDDFTVGATRTLTFNNGTFDANNKNVSAGLVSSAVATVRTVTMGNGTWALTGSGTVWNFGTVTNLTFNRGASTVKFTDNSGVDKTFTGGGLAYWNLWNATSGAGRVIIGGSNVFNEFRSDVGRTNRFTAGTTQTLSTFTAVGSAGNLITLESSGAAIYTLVKTGGGAIPADYVSVSWSVVSPTNTWFAGANSTDGGNNTGWTFSVAAMRPSAMLAEGQTNPLGVLDASPEFSAIFNDPNPGDTADTYHIQVDDDPAFGSPFWDSGLTAMANCTQGQRCQDVSYGGAALGTGTRWYWRIRFRDVGATISDWSADGDYFEMYVPPPDRYWVGGAGNWSDTAHWAQASGGAGGFSLPTFSEDAHFDAASGAGTVTVDVTGTCKDLDFTGFTGTFAGASGLTVYGSLVMDAAMTRTYTGALTFAATDPGMTLTFNGKTLASAVNFNGSGGEWTVQDAWNNGAAAITLTAGTLDTNGQTLTTTGVFSISGASPRTLTMGASTLNVGTWTATTITNLAFNPGASVIKVTGATTFNGGTLTYNEVQLNAASNTIGQANTFATLTRTGTATQTDTLILSADQTVTGTLTLAGNSSTNRLFVRSDVKPTQRTLTVAAVVTSNSDFQDIRGAGAADWDLSAATGGSGDAGGNAAITFTTGQTNYWVGGTGNWAASAEWASASGGGGGTGRVPLPQDDARFDGNSFGSGGLTVTANMPRLGRSIDWSAVTNNPTYTLSTTASLFGSLTLDALTLGAATQVLTFEGRGAFTLTSAGLTFQKPITLDAPGGTLTLQDDFTIGVTRTLTVNTGTFNANNKAVSAGLVSSNVATTRSVNMGSGLWTLTGSGTVWNFATVTNLTLDPNTSVIKFTDNSVTNKTFAGGARIYYDLWNATLGTGKVVIQGSNTFHDFKIDAARTTQFTGASTQTVNSFTATGSAGNVITLESSSALQFILSKTGGGTVVSDDYLSVSLSSVNPPNTWYAGNNSTNGGSNVGWIFTVPPYPTALLADAQTNPEGLTNETPVFSAVFNDGNPANTAVNYQVQVDDDLAFGSPLWDSGKTAQSSCAQGARCQDVTYAGPALESETRWYWRIKFWDLLDVEGAWSIDGANFTALSARAPGVGFTGGGFPPF